MMIFFLKSIIAESCFSGDYRKLEGEVGFRPDSLKVVCGQCLLARKILG